MDNQNELDNGALVPLEELKEKEIIIAKLRRRLGRANELYDISVDARMELINELADMRKSERNKDEWQERAERAENALREIRSGLDGLLKVSRYLGVYNAKV